MIHLLVVIPSRGGSKGITKKNLKVVHDRSLTEWAIRSALIFKEIISTQVVLSSDDLEILSEADAYPEVFASKRPEYLATDIIPDFQVLRYELLNSEKVFGVKFDYLIMLQPTSPVRDYEELISCVELLKANEKTAVWTVSEVPSKFHPRKQLMIHENLIEPYLKTSLVARRQDLDVTLIRNGVCYGMTRETVLSDERLMGNKCAFIKSKDKTYNIDSSEDLLEVINGTIVKDGLLIPRRDA